MTAPQTILDLVERFDYNRDNYRNPQYNETQLRREFLDPFFTALGWDVENREGYAEAYKDVVHEDAIKIGGVNKAPDYSFRIGGTRKFFVEAKKPAVNLKDDPKPAFQLRRYAWSAKLPLSILSDFEEFAVYDCRVQPDERDKPGIARTLYIPYTEYAARWHEIEAVFSRSAILKGAFDKYAVDNKTRRGTAEVDAAFLKEIETWRESLAQNIALRNPDLRNRDLNFAVQIIIDRIIFLRICEDRGIDIYGRLQALLNGKDVYQRLLLLFREADERYNSGLFHFRMEKGRDEAGLDTLTPRLNIDDKTLKDILTTLYYPCPYEFSVLPADILGQVYEQFLGKVIRLDAKHRAIVEDKPEVKKAGGVYYTPTYIVNYIVEQTVGKLLENKTPRQVEKLKILDPACGSGSFLIGAYQRLLDWHQQWYETDGIDKNGANKYAKGKDARLYQGAGNAWHLTTSERKRILLANLYGVDIDAQAVEVTKLSLLLKMLEGETQQTVNATLSMFHERVLPDLDANIQCGNSLIAPDFYDGRQLTLLDEDEMYRVNVFDWQKAFPKILTGDNPGFDAVIGNPPWGSQIFAPEKDYLATRFVNRRGEAESHIYFLEIAHRLLNHSGIAGYITPNTWLSVQNSTEVRRHLLDNASFQQICELSKHIFRDAPDIVPIMVFFNRKQEQTECEIRRTEETRLTPGNFSNAFTTSYISPTTWAASRNCVINLRASEAVLGLVKHCKEFSIPLSEAADVVYGIKTGNNGKYLSTAPSQHHTVKALKTGELRRYDLQWKKYYLWYSPELAGYRSSSLEVPKIVVQYIRKLSMPQRILAAMDSEGVYYPLNNYSYIISKGTMYSLHYIMGVLCSRLLNFYFANTFIDYNIKPTYLQQLPIRAINFDNATDKVRHDRMVQLVEQMLTLHKQLPDAAPTTRTVLQRQIELTDRQIDALVYELYALTLEEIALVENSGEPEKAAAIDTANVV